MVRLQWESFSRLWIFVVSSHGRSGWGIFLELSWPDYLPKARPLPIAFRFQHMKREQSHTFRPLQCSLLVTMIFPIFCSSIYEDFATWVFYSFCLVFYHRNIPQPIQLSYYVWTHRLFLILYLGKWSYNIRMFFYIFLYTHMKSFHSGKYLEAKMLGMGYVTFKTIYLLLLNCSLKGTSTPIINDWE